MMLLANAAAVQDMTGKMFLFPQETSSAYVKLNTDHDSDFRAITVCHRSFTDLKRGHTFFSMATPTKSNGFLTFYDSNLLAVAPHVYDVKLTYGGVDYAHNKWHSMCTTWDANTGLVQLWFDGQPLTKKYISGSTLTGQPIILLGQDQDSYGGTFDAKQSLVGMMTDVHMWDHEISSCEIQKYTTGFSFTPGNVINWAALDFQINGNVVVEKRQETCDSMWL